jgi:hypothetical protein
MTVGSGDWLGLFEPEPIRRAVPASLANRADPRIEVTTPVSRWLLVALPTSRRRRARDELPLAPTCRAERFRSSLVALLAGRRFSFCRSDSSATLEN